MLRFALISREGCELCDEMLVALERFCAGRTVDIRVLDVDTDPVLQRRFGLKVPVLLLDDEPICYGHFDAEEVERLIRPRA
jgi:hypothetical protein